MSTPQPPSRMSMPRSSFAIAMKDYTFIRPGIAITVSAITLLAALLFGVVLIKSLRKASETTSQGARTSAALHIYNAKYEVWREMATTTDPAFKKPEAIAQRDSMRANLQASLSRLETALPDEPEKDLVRQVLVGLASTDQAATDKARQAMIVLLGQQDRALFEAAETARSEERRVGKEWRSRWSPY